MSDAQSQAASDERDRRSRYEAEHAAPPAFTPNEEPPTPHSYCDLHQRQHQQHIDRRRDAAGLVTMADVGDHHFRNTAWARNAVCCDIPKGQFIRALLDENERLQAALLDYAKAAPPPPIIINGITDAAFREWMDRQQSGEKGKTE